MPLFSFFLLERIPVSMFPSFVLSSAWLDHYIYKHATKFVSLSDPLIMHLVCSQFDTIIGG